VLPETVDFTVVPLVRLDATPGSPVCSYTTYTVGDADAGYAMSDNNQDFRPAS